MTAIVRTCVLLCATVAAAPKEGEDKMRYLRLQADKTATECTFTVQRTDKGWSIASVTERGTTKMTVTARYDSQDALLGAEAVLTKGEQKMAARVTVTDGKARVTRDVDDSAFREFEVPKGVIVTSAPDWTDTFLLCQRYDRQKGGKQEFAGLWIHPEQAAQRLAFS